MENKRVHSQTITNLVKTDYDNFRDMRFFVEQQRKAQAMLREVEEFTHSFLDSKLMSVGDVMSDYHNWLTFEPGRRMENSFKAYIDALCNYYLFIKGYQKNNSLTDKSYNEVKEYISQHIDYSEKTFRYYIESFINEYNSDSMFSDIWEMLKKERPVRYHDYRNSWDDGIIRYEQYNPYGKFRHRHWDIQMTSPIIRWIKDSMWRGGTEYGEHIARLGLNDSFSTEIKDAYDKHPHIKICKSGVEFVRGTVNQDVAIERILQTYKEELEEVQKRVLKYGIRVPNETYVKMLDSKRDKAFETQNLVFNPHTVKCIVDYKNQRLIPFMDEKTNVNIEILDKVLVLRCTAIQKHQTEPLRDFKDYDTHFIRKVVLDFDLNTNELVNATEEDINDKDIIWKENI